MSCSATPANKLELTLDEQDVAAVQTTAPCATPKGYRAIPVEIKPTAWKTDLSKCNVCEARFSWLNHRHKCRKCMEAVCNSCSQDRKVLRAHTAPKRVCDTCVKRCWTPRPRDTPTTPRKLTAPDTAAKPAGRRVSLTVSASDANACPVVATDTAPLSPGTPAAAGFFGPGCVTPSAAAAPAPAAPTPVEGAAAGDTDKNATTGSSNVHDGRPSSSSLRRRHHRRQASVATPSLPPASPGAASSSPMVMLPPPTPVAAGGVDQANDSLPPSAPGSLSPSSPASAAPFFGGRQGGTRARGSRRESSGGRLESNVWSGGARALGGGGDVDKAVAELVQLQEAEKLVEAEREGQRAEVAPSAPLVPLPALPEEPADAAPGDAAAAASAAAVSAAEQEGAEEEDGDFGEGGPMMMKIPVLSGVAMGGIAIGTGVFVVVLLRRAVSLVFF